MRGSRWGCWPVGWTARRRRRLNEYELLYVISPRLSAEDVDAMVERVGALIEDGGGSVSMVDNWGRRRLAYPIRHHFEGTYVLTHLNMSGDRTAEFERTLNINEDILRHLLISGVIPGYEGPPEQEVDMRRPAGGRPSFADRPPADAPDGDAPAGESAGEGEAPAAEAPAEASDAPAAEAPAPDASASTEAADTPTAEAPAPEADEPTEAADTPAAEAPAPDADAPAEAEAAPAEADEPTEAPPAAVAGTE
ncbi:MAG: 30S ribosomal protein S6 [Chloroflexi bacterium]|nr:30S ribosomal protein S6 [Chloroflexota bacterium]